MSGSARLQCNAMTYFSDMPLNYGPQRCIRDAGDGHGDSMAEPHWTKDGRWWTVGSQPAPVRNDNPAIVDLVLADLKERDQIGQRRYGTRLQAHNGRDALRDAYEEVLDLAIYLRQVIEERKP